MPQVQARLTALGITIEDGLATVDLSSEFEAGGGTFSMAARLAQVVFTLTQFPTVREVEFRRDGEPVTIFSGEGIILDHPVGRDDYQELIPLIFVDDPAYGARPLKRLIQKELEDRIALALLTGDVCDGDTVLPSVNGKLMNEAHECSDTSGRICIQSEGAPTRWRNIRIRGD